MAPWLGRARLSAAPRVEVGADSVTGRQPEGLVLLSGRWAAGSSGDDPAGAQHAMPGAWGRGDFPGVRFFPLGGEPETALLKAVEAMDRHLPDWVIVVGSTPSPGVTLPGWAVNEMRPARTDSLGATGPARLAMSLPVSRLMARLGREGIRAVTCDDPADAECNRLAYALLHYVTLRGVETWFRRTPPAGLVAAIGVVLLPEGAAERDFLRTLGALIDELSSRN